MWFVLIQVGIIVASYVYHRITAPDAPKRVWQTQPTIPTVTEGVPLPLIYGRTRIRQPVLAWWGGFSHVPIQFASQLDYYTMDMLFVLGIPASTVVKAVTMPDGSVVNRPVYSRLLAIYVGDKSIPLVTTFAGGDRVVDWHEQGNTLNSEYATSPPYAPVTGVTGEVAYGYVQGDSSYCQGGFGFNLFWYDGHEVRGETVQDVGTGLFASNAMTNASGVSPTKIPGFAHQMVVGVQTGPDYGFVLPGFSGNIFTTWGTDPNPPALSFEVIDGSYAGLTTGFPYVGPASGDANPISVIVDLLCGACSFGKVGLDPAFIDTTSFLAAAATLKAEEHGYSRHVIEGTAAADLIGEIMQQIAAVMWIDQATTTLKIRLLRADYDPHAIPTFSPTNVKELRGFSTSSWSDTFNKIVLTFTDRNNQYDSGTVTAQNLGNAASQDNRVRTKTVSYPGICEIKIAAAVAARDLSVLCRPFSKCQMAANRDAASLSVGDVVSLTWPEYGLVSVVFRVMGVDVGALEDNLVIVDLLQDALADQTTSHQTYPGTFTLLQAAPLLRRRVEEAPVYLQRLAQSTGTINDSANQRVLALAAPTDNDTGFSVSTRGMVTNDVFVRDVATTETPVAMQVDTAYARELEPYDTTTGLILKNVTTSPSYQWLVPLFTFTHDDIFYFGKTLTMVGGELIAFESVTALGGGRWRLNNVWRGLCDTPPVAHVPGEDVFVLGPDFNPQRFVGTRAWGSDPYAPAIRSVVAGWQPQGQTSLGGATYDTLPQMRMRGLLGIPLADFRLEGVVMQGVSGLPMGGGGPVWGSTYKKVINIEEEFSYEGASRSRLFTGLSRGNESQPSDVDVTYEAWAQKGAVLTKLTPLTANAGIVAQSSYLLGVVGYGQMDVLGRALRTRNEVGKTAIGVYEWSAPRVATFAPRWRNLLCGARFQQVGNGATDLRPGWVTSSGGPQCLLSVTNIDRNGGASGNGFVSGSTGVTPAVFTQIVDVTGYNARGMQALLEYYAFNRSADVNDTVTVSMQPRDATHANIGSATTDGPWVPSTATWGRRTFSIASLPALTTEILITVTLTGVGDTTPDSCVTEWRLQLGQLTDNVLTNYSFETGSIASWTVGVGSWSIGTALPGASANYVSGATAASVTLFQEYTLPAGWEEGTSFVVNGWVMNTLANDTSMITIDVRDSGGSVLATASTTASAVATLNMWSKRRVAIDSVEGAFKIRVTLTGTRNLGSGLCGVSFDEIVVQTHKDLTDPRVLTDMLLTSPSTQQMPRDWNEFWLAYPTFVQTFSLPLVISGDAVAIQSRLIGYGTQLQWSDGVSRPKLAATGQFGGGQSIVNAFRSTRQTGANVPRIVSWGSDETGVPLLRPSSPAVPTEGMSVAVLFRVDERSFTTACGLIGRRDNTGNGWSLDINASGRLTSTFDDGLGGSFTVTDTTNVADGAWHLAMLYLDPIIGLSLTIGCELTSASVGVVDIDLTTGTAPLQLLRSTDTIDTLPGCVARVYIWPCGSSNPDVASMRSALWNLGKDPTGNVTTYARTIPAWAAGKPDAVLGETLNCLGPSQIAFGYDADLASFTDGLNGDGMGLAVSGVPYLNLTPSFDFSNGAAFVLESGASQVIGAVSGPNSRYDNTALTLGAGSVGTNGLIIPGMTFDATTTAQFVFYALVSFGSPVVKFELLNSSNVVKNTQTATLTGDGLWHRYQVSFTGWDASTATAKIRLSSNSGSAVFHLCEIICIVQGTDVPTLWASKAGVSMGADTTVTMTGLTWTKQMNLEGELRAQGVCTQGTFSAQRAVAQVKNAVNAKNERDLAANATNQPMFTHWDSTPASNVSSTTAIDWRQPWDLRGRWCAAKTLDVTANAFAGIVAVGSAGTTSNYGRTAIFAYDATHDSQLGVGLGSGGAINCYLRRLILRTKEEKL